MKKRLALVFIFGFIGILSVLYFSSPFEVEKLSRCSNLIIKSRQGKILRFIPDREGKRRLWANSQEIPSLLKQAFIAAEDANFYTHPGFDCLAILRALKDNIIKKRIVSGASTITQQLARALYPRRRNYWNKIREIITAIKIERVLTKEEILTQYLNRVPLGNNLQGVKLAARVYFGKMLGELTLSECATLAALPKAPGKLNPYGCQRAKLKKRRDWILTRMAVLNFISAKECSEAQKEKLYFQPFRFPFRAGHFVDALLQRKKLSGEILTTLDLDFQIPLERILKSHFHRLKARGANQASVLLVRNNPLEVLALVGSFEYSSRANGYNNGCFALRSPGSTLKPFLYALALETGWHAASVLEDVKRIYPSPTGDYLPCNFSRQEYGPVTIRHALGNSLNLAAVRMLNLIGYQNFYQFLQKINLINYPWRDADYYGLGLVIGNPEVTLEQLVCAYAMLANGGKYQKCSYILGEKQLPPRSIISPQTAYIITDILKDASARMLGFGNTSIFSLPVPVALKTGTSTHYRDCWIIGYTPEYTLGVWVGNFEGNPTYQLSGAEAAGPIFRDIINFLYRWSYPGEFPLPEDIITLGICPYSGCLPNVYCPYISRELFWKGSEPQKKCSFHTTSLPRHRLTPAYAAWLYQKKCQGTLGQYRLQGFGEDLESVFDNPWKKIEGREEASLEIENSPKYFSNRIRIIYPFNNDRFLLGRNAKNGIIKLWAISEKPVKYITWYINGREYAKTQPPYQIYWRLKKGKHSIIAFDPNNIGDEVIIRVE